MSTTSSGQRALPSNVVTGLSLFAATILMVQGAFQVLQGVALLVDETQFATNDDYVYELNPTTWGWVQIVLGVLAVLIALGILARASWGVVTGIVVVALSAVANFAFIPFYPAWALVIIGLDLAVIWALCALVQSQRHAV